MSSRNKQIDKLGLIGGQASFDAGLSIHVLHKALYLTSCTENPQPTFRPEDHTISIIQLHNRRMTMQRACPTPPCPPPTSKGAFFLSFHPTTLQREHEAVEDIFGRRKSSKRVTNDKWEAGDPTAWDLSAHAKSS